MFFYKVYKDSHLATFVSVFGRLLAVIISGLIGVGISEILKRLFGISDAVYVIICLVILLPGAFVSIVFVDKFTDKLAQKAVYGVLEKDFLYSTTNQGGQALTMPTYITIKRKPTKLKGKLAAIDTQAFYLNGKLACELKAGEEATIPLMMKHNVLRLSLETMSLNSPGSALKFEALDGRDGVINANIGLAKGFSKSQVEWEPYQ